MKDIDTIENAPENWWQTALWSLMVRVLLNQEKQLECLKLVLEDSLTDESITALNNVITETEEVIKNAVTASEVLRRKEI